MQNGLRGMPASSSENIRERSQDYLPVGICKDFLDIFKNVQIILRSGEAKGSLCRSSMDANHSVFK